MHTVEALEAAIKHAVQLGFEVRQEWLGGNGGGTCEIRGKMWLFLDLAVTPEEQLETVREALAAQDQAASAIVPFPTLRSAHGREISSEAA